MLREKLQDTAVLMSDTDAKRDIMSLLVRARKAELDKDKTVYAMSDQAMMDQVVSVFPPLLCNFSFRPPQLTFLGAGHETTATGLSWVEFLYFTPGSF